MQWPYFSTYRNQGDMKAAVLAAEVAEVRESNSAHQITISIVVMLIAVLVTVVSVP